MTHDRMILERVRRRLSLELAKHVSVRPAVALNRRALISFTFDDVPESAFRNGASILLRRGVRGTFYIAAQFCGTTDANVRYIDSRQCVELHQQGHEIGCHTFSHPNLRRVGRTALAREVNRNRAFFAELDGIPLDNFAYPYGATSLSRRMQLQGMFRSCRSTAPGINTGAFDLGYLRAVELCHGRIDLQQVQAWIDAAIEEGGWLIFLTHDVSDTPTRWGCTPSFFAEAVARADNSGCEVVTVREALELAQIVPRNPGMRRLWQRATPPLPAA